MKGQFIPYFLLKPSSIFPYMMFITLLKWAVYSSHDSPKKLLLSTSPLHTYCNYQIIHKPSNESDILCRQGEREMQHSLNMMSPSLSYI